MKFPEVLLKGLGREAAFGYLYPQHHWQSENELACDATTGKMKRNSPSSGGPGPGEGRLPDLIYTSSNLLPFLQPEK